MYRMNEKQKDCQTTCQRCQQAEMRRLNRRGVLEKFVLSNCGYYPWECVECRKKRYLRDNGQQHQGVSTAA